MSFEQLLTGALFAAVIAALAFRAHALTRSGAFAAFGVGTLTYGAGGWAFTLILLAFFVPSVALSRVGRARKKRLVDIGKGGARDAWQVLANGGVATICAVFAEFVFAMLAPPGASPRDGHTFGVIRLSRFPAALGNHAPGAWIAAFAGSYAAAAADTWGTEIGTLMRGRPHSILTFRPIAAGLSGGVTLAGTAAEIAGAAWIALAAAVSLMLFKHWPQAGWSAGTMALVVGPVCAGGIAGALTDSVLGATLQELRHCPACERACETNPHACGTPTVRIRGVPGCSNDAVNFAATFTGAAVAFALAASAFRQ